MPISVKLCALFRSVTKVAMNGLHDQTMLARTENVNRHALINSILIRLILPQHFLSFLLVSLVLALDGPLNRRVKVNGVQIFHKLIVADREAVGG